MPLSGASDGGIAVDEIKGRWPANPRKHWRFRLFRASVVVLPETTKGGRSRNTLEVSVYPMVTILLHVFAGKTTPPYKVARGLLQSRVQLQPFLS